MDVTFTRTGVRRYGVSVELPDGEVRGMSPAPGFDDDIPHDLVHYLVEAELGLTMGVFGRAAKGGGPFWSHREDETDHRARRREERRRKRRADRLRRDDQAGEGEMGVSEMLAGVCDVVWRRRHGQVRGRPGAFVLDQVPEGEQAKRERVKVERQVERVVGRLDEVAPLWRGLEVGGALRFTWPQVSPRVEAGRRG